MFLIYLGLLSSLLAILDRDAYFKFVLMGMVELVAELLLLMNLIQGGM